MEQATPNSATTIIVRDDHRAFKPGGPGSARYTIFSARSVTILATIPAHASWRT